MNNNKQISRVPGSFTFAPFCLVPCIITVARHRGGTGSQISSSPNPELVPRASFLKGEKMSKIFEIDGIETLCYEYDTQEFYDLFFQSLGRYPDLNEKQAHAAEVSPYCICDEEMSDQVFKDPDVIENGGPLDSCKESWWYSQEHIDTAVDDWYDFCKKEIKKYAQSLT